MGLFKELLCSWVPEGPLQLKAWCQGGTMGRKQNLDLGHWDVRSFSQGPVGVLGRELMQKEEV